MTVKAIAVLAWRGRGSSGMCTWRGDAINAVSKPPYDPGKVGLLTISAECFDLCDSAEGAKRLAEERDAYWLLGFPVSKGMSAADVEAYEPEPHEWISAARGRMDCVTSVGERRSVTVDAKPAPGDYVSLVKSFRSDSGTS